MRRSSKGAEANTYPPTHSPLDSTRLDSMQAYRANTLYTCNCTGDYSYLAGLANTRVGNVVAFQASVNQLVSTLVMPAFGAYIDFEENRRGYWIAIWLAAVVSTCLMGILSPNYGWLAVSRVRGNRHETCSTMRTDGSARTHARVRRVFSLHLLRISRPTRCGFPSSRISLTLLTPMR